MHTDVHRFGRRNILALATTCKLYAVGLYDEVRCAQRSNALVRWPLCGAVVYLKRTIRVRDGLVNGAPLLVLYVSGDFAETLSLSSISTWQAHTAAVRNAALQTEHVHVLVPLPREVVPVPVVHVLRMVRLICT